MRALALIVFATLTALTAVAQEVPGPEGIWKSPAPQHASTSRWVCSGLGDNVIEFRFYPALVKPGVARGEGLELWIIRHGQTFMYATRFQQGLQAIFALIDSSHEIHIGADRIARYYTFSGKEGELLQPSAIWVNCKETR